MDHSEEMLAEVDEPPDEWSPTKLHFGYLKAQQPPFQRRESLLTRQLHSETEHTDDDMPPPPRTLSTQSTWSNPSTASTAELTSDDGRSVASPAISPPLPPTHSNHALPVSERPLDAKVKIVGQDLTVPSGEKETGSEKSVEANLGRKRCISFACRSKAESKPTQPPAAEPIPSESTITSPPKRKCMIKFACPMRAGSDTKPMETTQNKRPVSPPPPARRPSVKHRGSDSTVTHASPKSVRKSSSTAAAASPEISPSHVPTHTRKLSNDSSDEDDGKAVSWHEFGSSEDDEWVQQSTCHRSRLTVNDTLQKENVIRKTCEEVEEEALEEEEEDEEEELDDELATVADMDDENEEGNGDEEDYESDEGFHSDDEDGFANSDSENEDSDYEWWKPGGVSTAATSVEQLDRLAIVNLQQPVSGSSVGSASSAQLSRHSSKGSVRKAAPRHSLTPAMPIKRPVSPDLPDSTDFVCGTLDEDRPLEQAYINRKKMRDAAKHKARPQDIDPTFPTSDHEMDEEDDDDVDEAAESDEDDLMHGDLDELHGTAKKHSPTTPRGRNNAQKSSPPPTTRVHSPRPPAKRTTARSPPPPAKRSTARSPPPRKLFGHSPHRTKSPAPVKRMTSPPNSPIERTAQLSMAPQGLAGRPQLTHTASLPRGGPITLSKLATIGSDDEDTETVAPTAVPKRGAIDIVKGVEWKRKFRKEKLYRKMCAKAAEKGEKPIKVKPGKGCERMREVGLQLKEYRGKAEHILSL